MQRLLLIALIVLPLIVPIAARAQTTTSAVEDDRLERATVLTVGTTSTEVLPGSNTTVINQEVQIRVEEGLDKGTVTSFLNNYTPVTKGETVYIRHSVGGFGPETWAIADAYRLPVLVAVFALFLLLIVLFGGLPGLRGLASLVGSIALIFGVLLPGIYAGYPAALVAVLVAGLIIVVGSYITHGINRTTTAAMFGMLATVLVVGIATYFVIHAAQLTGFTGEENAYLNFDTNGRIDMLGLLFGGIMIGLLGVLYDIAIGQAVAVEELLRVGTQLSRREVYARGLRIGREHIGALINTLAIAYVGSSLPLLLLFHDATASPEYLLNSERFATEILRILMGSIGLILAVPITTLIAAMFIKRATHTHSHLAS